MSERDRTISRLLTPRLARLVASLGVLLTVSALVIGYQLNIYSFRGAIPAWYFPLTESAPAIASLLVGGLIAARLPGNLYGWLWILLGFGFGGLQPWGGLLASLALSASPPQTVLAGSSVQLAMLGWLLGATMIPMVFLYYPTGRLQSHRWKVLVWVILAAALIAGSAAWAVPGPSAVAPVENPFGIQGAAGELSNWLVGIPTVLILVVGFPLAVLSLILRFRRGAGLQRAQIKWLAYAALINLIFFGLGLLPVTLPLLSEETEEVLSTLLLVLLPIAVAFAILRYRLFEIDLIIRRTLVYGALTATLAVVYLGLAALLQDLFSTVSGQESSASIVLSTLAIAALFTPLRRRIQNTIDRRFYRRKYDAGKALAAFGQIAREEVDLESLSRALLAVAEETMQPERASLWLVESRHP